MTYIANGPIARHLLMRLQRCIQDKIIQHSREHPRSLRAKQINSPHSIEQAKEARVKTTQAHQLVEHLVPLRFGHDIYIYRRDGDQVTVQAQSKRFMSKSKLKVLSAFSIQQLITCTPINP